MSRTTPLPGLTPLALADAKVNDPVRFYTRGPIPECVHRTGVISRITERTVAILCDWTGETAVIHRDRWDERSVMRIGAAPPRRRRPLTCTQ